MFADTTAVVILAAGSSSRLGYAKQLIHFRGKRLLQHSIDAASHFQFCSNTVVVGARAHEVLEDTELKIFSAVINEDWEEGMASSIRLGLKHAIDKVKDLEHIIILLADQPFVNVQVIENLISKHIESKSDATFCEYSDVVGVPAIFSKTNFKALEQLTADQGAKKLLQDQNFKYNTVKFDQGTIDVDTAEDVLRLKQLE